jgi:hypothetical protein
VPAALGLAALLMLVITWIGRGLFSPEGAFFARFVFLCTALLLPLVAWAAEQGWRLSRWSALPLALLLGLGASLNIAGWQQWARGITTASYEKQLSMAALLGSTVGPDIPDWVRPDAMGGIGTGTGDAPWGTLRQMTALQIGVQHHQVPVEFANQAELLLRLADTGRPADLSARCIEHSGPTTLSLVTGERFGFIGAEGLVGRLDVTASLVRNGLPQALPATFSSPVNGHEVQVVGAPDSELIVQLASAVPGATFTVCR